MGMGNAFRFIRYTLRVMVETLPRHRHKHQRGFWRRNGVNLIAAFGGAMLLMMPLWMIVLGII